MRATTRAGVVQRPLARDVAIFVAVAALSLISTAHLPGHPGTQVARTPLAPGRVASSVVTAYERAVLAQKPVFYLPLTGWSGSSQTDASGHGHTVTAHPTAWQPATTTLPDGERAPVFNGTSDYLATPSTPSLSVSATGVLTVQAWIKPATIQFPSVEGTGYVNYLGKGQGRQEEYELRVYSKTNTEHPVRPNRMSAYAFNLAGGEGSGAYFQDPMTANQWIFVTMVINTNAKSSLYPTGYVRIYKDATLRGTVALSQFSVVPKAGTAPFQIGSTRMDSFFDGAIAQVAVYGYELSDQQVAADYRAMTGSH